MAIDDTSEVEEPGSSDDMKSARPRKRWTVPAILSLVALVVIIVGIRLVTAYFVHSAGNTIVSQLQGGSSNGSTSASSSGGNTTGANDPAWSSSTVKAERENESPNQVAHDISSLLAEAYEAGSPVWATDYLENVFNCRDASCGYTGSLSQISTLFLMEREPGGNIIRSTASATSTPGQVSGTINVQTAHHMMTGTFTAVWNSISHEWLATTITWNAVPHG